MRPGLRQLLQRADVAQGGRDPGPLRRRQAGDAARMAVQAASAQLQAALADWQAQGAAAGLLA